MSELEPRPCHLCGGPRGEAHIDPVNHPGKLLCARCAGVTGGAEWTRRVIVALRDGMNATGAFERQQADAEVTRLLKELDK